jgi:tRNA-specific 2-thiouridylase
VGDLEKKEVREIALKYDLATAKKKDSTGICFIGERRFHQFLQNYLPAKPGKMVRLNGEVIGNHDGLMYYTIGQRKGLGIGGAGDAWFVIGKDIKKNILYVGQGSDQELLYANRVIVRGINIINERFTDGMKLSAKFRYRQPDTDITVKWLDEDTLEVTCLTPVKAITPGQACVFYSGEYCLGGGTIDEVYMNDIKREY